MLCKHKEFLSKQKIVLGSSSPQRMRICKDLLGLTSLSVVASNFAENIPKDSCRDAAEYCLRTTQGKVDSLNQQLEFDYNILICADTIVVTDHGDILEKPIDAADASRMLTGLSGSSCKVLTSCILSFRVAGMPRQILTHVESTSIEFLSLQAEDIAAYVSTGEPLNKSGAFGFQALGSSLVHRIVGCPYNVEGFPACAFAQMLNRAISIGSSCVQQAAKGIEGIVSSEILATNAGPEQQVSAA